MCVRWKAIKDYSFRPNGPHVNLYSKIHINLFLKGALWGQFWKYLYLYVGVIFIKSKSGLDGTYFLISVGDAHKKFFYPPIATFPPSGLVCWWEIQGKMAKLYFGPANPRRLPLQPAFLNHFGQKILNVWKRLHLILNRQTYIYLLKKYVIFW